MEDAWDRRHALLTLDDKTLAAMLAPAFPERRILTAQPLTEGKINTNYRVTLSGLDDPVVLRVYARDPAACHKEVEIERLVRGRVAMPQALYADLDGSHTGQPYAITRWAEGVKPHTILPDSTDAEAEEIGAALGQQLAAIGSHTFPQSGFFGPHLTIAEPFGPLANVCAPYIEECLRGHAGHVLGSQTAARLWKLIQQRLPLLSTVDTTPRLAHGDYKSANLLMRRERDGWRVSAVLDWEFAFVATSLFDLGQLLRAELDLSSSFARGVTSGFVAGDGLLPAAWRTIIRLLDLVNLCEFLNTPTTRGTLHRDMIALIEHTISEWEHTPVP